MMKLLFGVMLLVACSGCAADKARQPDTNPRAQIDAKKPDDAAGLSGSVGVNDQGQMYVPKSGTMQFYVSPWHGDEDFVNVTVHDGRWECSRRWDGRILGIGRIQLDGREAFTAVDEFVDGRSREISVEAHWLEPKRLHIVDAHTGVDVPGVRIRFVGWIENKPQAGSELARGDGSFTLDPWRMWMWPGANKDGYDVWIEAPGHAPRVQFLNPWTQGIWLVEL